LARQVFEENEAQRNRRRAIKDVRQQSFELAAIRRKKAMDFRKQKVCDYLVDFYRFYTGRLSFGAAAVGGQYSCEG
jgi:hypothetical protein